MASATSSTCVYTWEGIDSTGKLLSGELRGQSPALIKTRPWGLPRASGDRPVTDAAVVGYGTVAPCERG